MKDLLAKATTLMEALPWIKDAWGKHGRDQVRRRRDDRPGAARPGRRRHRSHEARGREPRRRARRRSRDHRASWTASACPSSSTTGCASRRHEAMDIVKMVLVGKVNKELVSAINSHGRYAVGLSGRGRQHGAGDRERREAGPRRRCDRHRHHGARQPHRGRLHTGRRHGGCGRRRWQLQRERRPRRRPISPPRWAPTSASSSPTSTACTATSRTSRRSSARSRPRRPRR